VCGIIGIVGRDDAVPLILDGLRRLEYRGYDSAGIVVHSDGALATVRRAGKLAALVDALDGTAVLTTSGIGHTRWATHGAPTDINAHPHCDPTGRVAVVHNGIIENYQQLRAEFDPDVFVSDTDSEVVAHLVARVMAVEKVDLFAAVQRVVPRLIGAYSLCLVANDEPDTIVVAKLEAPLIIATTDTAAYCASDVAALIAHTRDVAALLDGQIAKLTPRGATVVDHHGNPATPHAYHVSWDLEAAEKQGFAHFMRKEIFEQPTAVSDTLRDRLSVLEPARSLHLDELHIDERELARVNKVFILACGTSLHAGMLGKLAIEHWAGLPVDVEVASEFRYRDPIVDSNTLVIAISQSGETVDTIAAAQYAKEQQAPMIALVNVVGSTLARTADGVLYTHAGPEVAVASTKAFTTQIVGCLLLGLYLAQVRGTRYATEIAEVVAQLQEIPAAIDQVLASDEAIELLAQKYHDTAYTMFIGRHAGLPIAMEGALKLKEISYLHAEAFPAGEMKHGPIALIEPGSLVVAIAFDGHVFEKMISNIQEVRARGAAVLAITSASREQEIRAHADDVIVIPDMALELAIPVVAVVPLQLFSYHVANLRGEDVDQPRNLAKTVTVE
jgi:glutamine---fructose-6-phosphate transaminase (isomerizing)